MALGPGRFAGVVRDVASTTAQRGMPSRAVSAVGGGVSPATFGALALWLDASDTDTITSSSGAVSQWNDKSGFGRNFTQTTSANQPKTGTTTINGRNVVAFDGTNDDMNAGNTLNILTNNLTIMMVVQYSTLRTPNGGNTALSKYETTGSGGWSTLFEQTGSGPRVEGVYRAGTVAVATSSGSWTSTSPIVQEAVIDRGLGTVTQTINGAVNGTATFTVDNSTNRTVTASLTVGNLQPGFSNYWLNGNIAEAVVFERALSAGEQSKLREYLNAKWAVY